jgi:hypothetical protein
MTSRWRAQVISPALVACSMTAVMPSFAIDPVEEKAGAVASATPLRARDEKASADEEAKVSAEAFQTPTLPAMVLLNADTSDVERPGSVRDFGIALANVITPQGTVRSGIAMEVTPRALGLFRSTNAYRYRKDYWNRFVQRIGMSVATTAESATEATPSVTNLAIGLRIVVWDDADPLLDPASARALNVEAGECPETSFPNTVEGKQQWAGCKEAAVKEYITDAPDPAWNLGGLNLAGALSAVLPEGEADEASFGSAAAWLTAGLPIGSWAQLVGSVRFRHVDPDNGDLGLFARLRMGSARTRGYVETGLLRQTIVAESSATGRLKVGTEFLLAPGVWLSADIGGNFGRDAEEGNDVLDVFALSNLQWALEDAPGWEMSQ